MGHKNNKLMREPIQLREGNEHDDLQSGWRRSGEDKEAQTECGCLLEESDCFTCFIVIRMKPQESKRDEGECA
ncbi:hypothetical protein FGO68_gene14251 [Halteria grandinella]|uniref:Uncharacterized protein n=1 Tax=Halteria grandinella TaxID=5974 RepID=A0A8J8N9Q2_HALGN|nr:hypothetical protein FGO68_gene14251 [Halteria grandinella]